MLCSHLRDFSYLGRIVIKPTHGIQSNTDDIDHLPRDIENSDLQLALKVASEEVRDVVFRNMSKRMSDTFKEEMEYMGPVRLRDVEEAQTRIVATIRRLEEAGEVIIARGGGDDIIV